MEGVYGGYVWSASGAEECGGITLQSKCENSLLVNGWTILQHLLDINVLNWRFLTLFYISILENI